MKTRMKIEHETGNDLTQQEYNIIKIATTNKLKEYGLSWETRTNKTTQLEGKGLKTLLCCRKSKN